MADEAIKHMRDLNAAAPEQPFFVYYVPGGSHSPHQPKPEWVEKFKGKFDMGYEKLRDVIFANQKKLGVIPESTQLTPLPPELPKWESLSLPYKKLLSRQAEVFAGYTAYTDNEIGRVIQAVEDMPRLNGMDAAALLRRRMPEIKFVFLTVNEDPDLAAEAIRLGASG